MTDYRVWYCGDPGAPEIYTDPESLSWAWKKQLRRDRWNAGGYLALLGGQALVSMAVFAWGMGERRVDALVHYLICLLDFCAGGAALPSVHDGAAPAWDHPHRPAAETDGTLPHTGPWRKNRRRTAALVGGVWVALVMLALAVLLPKVTTRSVDLAEPGEPLPYVSLSTLDATAGIWAERSRPDQEHFPGAGVCADHGIRRGGPGEYPFRPTAVCFSGPGPLS